MTNPLGLPGRTSSRSGLRFRLFGFPVLIDLSFVIVLVFLGYASVSRGLGYLVVWVAVALLSVLMHELGHAFAARAAGAAPEIELSGFGGVTTFRLQTRPSRLRSLGISAAGPASGLVVGGALIALARYVEIDPTSTTAFVLDVAVFVTLGWGLLNLLPILPMDGGHILTELLPGAPERRERLAAMVSIGFAVIVGVLALLAGWLIAALLCGWFAFINIASLRPTPAEPAAEELTAEQVERRLADSRAALWLIDQGRIDEARHLAETAPAGVDPALAGVVLAYLGEVDRGQDLVLWALEQAPAEPLRQECLQRIRRLRPVDGPA